ncbi:hypothetical protein L227DRAFT_571804 [Lentinus tigrinus ALCF2SS1-6]|uniref:Transcription factor BYE1 n=1 Tax=Lentinus tigrinus ALCF2SS1-6 TaxID=1328759 RepID=A0A5C2SK40_9APHY|nr:hypothetical protein L227DRAFT_571804 [Lentinus tigrinus ALCF2SS1-6]
MIHCSTCKDWYHFRCVELSERDAEDIRRYVCPSCHQKTGERTIKEWEEPNPTQVDVATSKATSSPKEKKSSKAQIELKEDADSEPSSDGSDEYKPEDKVPKRRISRPSHVSDSDSDMSRAQSPKRLRRGSVATEKDIAPAAMSDQASPSTEHPSKRRKSSTHAHPVPPPKRPRSESTAGEDAARKYCSIKLQEMFCQIFTRYPFLRDRDEDDEELRGLLQPDKKTEELTPEEKEQLDAKAKQFGIDLEQCMYELYSEPDKQGKHVVAAKYKERFRMLTFNLSKADRIVLHMRIASCHISPKELSTMSSTDLASEEGKQSIKKLEEEALAHSILKKSTVPRAKLTHKGLQDIEDVTGVAQREAERERQEEEEERIERERLARLRLQAQRAQSQGSAPPESPVVGQAPSWGAPPPVPLHAQSTELGSPTSAVPIGRPPPNPLFVPSVSDFAGPLENELNLADLINIDEEASGEVAMTPVDALPTPFGETPPTHPETKSTEHVSQSTPSPITPTLAAGLSPFAAKGSQPETSARSSFNLNSLWTPGPSDAEASDFAAEPEPQDHAEPAAEDQPMGTDPQDGEAEDQDFDMFLNNDQEQEETKAPQSEPVEPAPEVQRVVAFADQAPVWTGTLSMPLDSAIPQEVAVVARQSGGRTLGEDSPLWQSLFPSKELRIDGRVPLEKSAQYLTQVRLNPTKELIAVAFCPTPGSNSAGFDALKNHLISKGRHGLIFPWGHNPKSSAPGRELYVVPLLHTEPIPEYMELLDQLQLPQERSVDYLVGVWVLTKGKLVPPPQPTPTPMPAIAPTVPQTSAAQVAVPNIDIAQLRQLGITLPQSQTLPGFQSQSPVGGSLSPPSVTTHSPAPPLAVPFDPSQIQLMLQALTGGTQQPGTFPQPPPSTATSPPQSVAIPHLTAPNPSQPIALPTAALQPWTANQPQYPPSGPPPYQQPPPYPPHAAPSGTHGSYGGGDRYERDRPYQNNGGYEYDRGFRGRGRGRGGDRGRGRDQGWQRGGPKGRGGPPPNGPRSNRGGGGGGGWHDEQRWN